MERTTTKHNPRMDDAMAGPTESRTQESRVQEDVEQAMPKTAVDERAELARHIAAAAFPATRDGLVQAAEEDHAPEHVLGALRHLPADQRFDNVQAVWDALG